MGKAVGGLSEATALIEAEGAPCRIGAYLALQRKLRGISLDELESQTHIPARSLQRLESGAYDDHPDGFVRGFVRTVSEAIGLDPDETVARMLAEPEATSPRRRVALGRLMLVLAVLGGAIGLGMLAPGLLALGSETLQAPTATPAPVATVRHDAVRALAESLAGGSPAPAPSAPLPASGGALGSPDGGDPDRRAPAEKR